MELTGIKFSSKRDDFGKAASLALQVFSVSLLILSRSVIFYNTRERLLPLGVF